tara:strand:- start:22216 stop:24219 length:2004 start_codon:yes stop_codon:yes gene_type:complete
MSHFGEKVSFLEGIAFRAGQSAAHGTTSATMSSARGATRRLVRLFLSYANASTRTRPVGFGGHRIGHFRFFGSAVLDPSDDIGPVTLDFSKLVKPGEVPSVAYMRLAKEGVLREDEAQRNAITVLDGLHAKLIGTNDSSGASTSTPSPPKKEGSWFADLFTSTDRASLESSQDDGPHSGGVYLHGGPGCGKTFVMDLAYACLPGTHGVEKKREHFHSFMLATHHALHKLGQAGGSKSRDTVALYAGEIAKDASVLCLDEFQVVDVADAMIIRRLLDELWRRGVKLVTTSNRAPNELYKNGLNRAQFVPCIEAINAKCAVHQMHSSRDYRLTGHTIAGRPEEEIDDGGETNLERKNSSSSSSSSSSLGGTWVTFKPGDVASIADTNKWLTGKLTRFAKNDRMVTVDVSINGRRIRVQNASGGVARFKFHEICDANLGAGDYTAIASVFHTVGVECIPVMIMDRVDLMRRFITFIDVLYEHKVKLLATAAETPSELFLKKSTSGENVDEEFAWARAASRLHEMQSAEYVEAVWRPKSGAWLLEQAKVTEVVPESVLRALWQRYDADHNGVLDESELECLLGDLNEMRRGHRNVPEEQLSSAWDVLTNRGKRGVGRGAGLGTVDSQLGDICDNNGGPAQRKMPSRRGDAFITFDDFIGYGNEAFAACMSE